MKYRPLLKTVENETIFLRVAVTSRTKILAIEKKFAFVTEDIPFYLIISVPCTQSHFHSGLPGPFHEKWPGSRLKIARNGQLR